MLQQLALLKGFNLDGLDVVGPDFIHLVVECSKLAYADREKFYGDPDFVEVPFPTLLSDAYNAERRKLVTEQGLARTAAGLGRGLRRGGQAEARRASSSPAWAPASRPSAAWAKWSATPCISTSSTRPATWCRRRRRAAGCNPRRSFRSSASASAPARRCSGSRKAIRPRSRPASGRARRCRRRSALRDGDAYLAWGSPGGDQQDQWITQFFLRHVHAGMNLQEAIDAPAWHSEHFPISFWPRTARPGVLQIEKRVPKATRDELARRGHIIEVEPEWSEGRLTAASKDGPRRRAAANPRGMQGYAAGR